MLLPFLWGVWVAGMEGHPLSELTLALTAPEASVRLTAVRALGQLGVEALPAVERLTLAVGDPQSEVREAVTQALIQIQGPQAVTLFAEWAKHASAPVRVEGMRGLKKLGPLALSHLAVVSRGFRDEDPLVRLEALRVAEHFPASLFHTAFLIKDPVEEVALCALSLLPFIGAPYKYGLTAGLMQAFDQQASPTVRREMLRTAVAVCGDEAVLVLQHGLRDPEVSLRKETVVLLAQLDRYQEMAGQALTLAFRDEDAAVRVAAVKAVGKIKGLGVYVNSLVQVLKDTAFGDSAMRLEALRALSNYSSGSGYRAFYITLTSRDPDPVIREEAIRLAAGIPPLSGRPLVRPLVAALQDVDPRVRVAATEVLGDIQSPSAIPYLRIFTHDRDLHVRTAASTALSASAEWWKQMSDDEVETYRQDPRKLTGLTLYVAIDYQPESAERAAAVFRALGPTTAPLLIPLLRHPRRDVRALAVETLGYQRASDALPHLIHSLKKDGSPLVRATVAWALVHLPSPKAREALTASLQDPKAEVREAAEWALKFIKETEKPVRRPLKK